MKYIYAFTFLTILILGTACNGQVKKDLPKETEHPKLIKTIGNPGYGNVQCGIQDKAGNLWFGTTENGLYKYDGKSFSRFLVEDGLNSNNIFCLLEDKDGKIWIGTDAGLCLYDPSAAPGTGGKTFAKIEIPLRKDLPPNKNQNDRNSRHWVFSMMQAKSGKLWFATVDGVYTYDGKSFTPFIIDEAAMGYMSTNNNAERMLEDKAGNIWFGGRGFEGVYRYDPSAGLRTGGKSVTNLKLKELIQDGPRPKAHVWAWPQLQDKNGNIWFSNWGGAYRYDPSASLRTGPSASLRTGPSASLRTGPSASDNTGSESFTSFTKSEGLPGGVTRIIEDKNGNLWFGGDGGAGLSRYDGESFTLFTTKDGLLNNSIWSILEDKTGNLWVGTRETGLYLYDGKTFILYSEYKQ